MEGSTGGPIAVPSAALEQLRRDQAAEVARKIRPETAGLWDALRDVLDPEIPISVVDLGLICDIRRQDSYVEVDVTFTSTACPAVEFIKDDIRTRLLREADVDTVQVIETWEVSWSSARVSCDGRAGMRRYGISL
jgi:metal-sulfur cluster biosynthetic enzyme